jgi:hypothetical protein
MFPNSPRICSHSIANESPQVMDGIRQFVYVTHDVPVIPLISGTTSVPNLTGGRSAAAGPLA